MKPVACDEKIAERVRVGPEGCAAALSRPHARRMDFTGRPLEYLVSKKEPLEATLRRVLREELPGYRNKAAR